MNKMRFRTVLSALVLLVAGSAIMQASAISGSLPFVIVNASQNGTNLLTSTMEFSTGSLTSGPGTGDFSIIPLLTPFTAVTLDNLRLEVAEVSRYRIRPMAALSPQGVASSPERRTFLMSP